MPHSSLPLSMSGDRVRRSLWVLSGCVSLALGVLGIFLPVLPTTPLVLLASACFMRGSPQLYHWLNRHPTFGPPLQNWRNHKSVTRSVKRKGLLAICLSFSLSIYLVSALWLKVFLALLFTVLVSWFAKLPVRDE